MHYIGLEQNLNDHHEMLHKPLANGHEDDPFSNGSQPNVTGPASPNLRDILGNILMKNILR